MNIQVPTLTPVKSSNIAAVGYDGKDLFVQYGSGGVYRYADVPAATHAELMKAESIGKYVGANIKGKFEVTKLPAEEKAESIA